MVYGDIDLKMHVHLPGPILENSAFGGQKRFYTGRKGEPRRANENRGDQRRAKESQGEPRRADENQGEPTGQIRYKES
jgi:hypothetical protein